MSCKSKTEIWVDGAYINDTISWAILVMQDNKEVTRTSGIVADDSLKKHRQVAGELEAAKNAILWCIKHDVKAVSIFFDYEGIRSWATSSWKANNPCTKSYVNFIKTMSKKVDITWVKVQAHSLDVNNEIVDKLTKKASKAK